MSVNSDYKKFLKHLGSNFRKIRDQRRMTQEVMAESLKLNYRYYQKLESGAYSPSLFTLFRLSKMLKVRLSDFLE